MVTSYVTSVSDGLVTWMFTGRRRRLEDYGEELEETMAQVLERNPEGWMFVNGLWLFDIIRYDQLFHDSYRSLKQVNIEEAMRVNKYLRRVASLRDLFRYISMDWGSDIPSIWATETTEAT